MQSSVINPRSNSLCDFPPVPLAFIPSNADDDSLRAVTRRRRGVTMSPRTYGVRPSFVIGPDGAAQSTTPEPETVRWTLAKLKAQPIKLLAGEGVTERVKHIPTPRDLIVEETDFDSPAFEHQWQADRWQGLGVAGQAAARSKAAGRNLLPDQQWEGASMNGRLAILGESLRRASGRFFRGVSDSTRDEAAQAGVFAVCESCTVGSVFSEPLFMALGFSEALSIGQPAAQKSVRLEFCGGQTGDTNALRGLKRAHSPEDIQLSQLFDGPDGGELTAKQVSTFDYIMRGDSIDHASMIPESWGSAGASNTQKQMARECLAAVQGAAKLKLASITRPQSRIPIIKSARAVAKVLCLCCIGESMAIACNRAGFSFVPIKGCSQAFNRALVSLGLSAWVGRRMSSVASRNEAVGVSATQKAMARKCFSVVQGAAKRKLESTNRPASRAKIVQSARRVAKAVCLTCLGDSLCHACERAGFAFQSTDGRSKGLNKALVAFGLSSWVSGVGQTEPATAA